MGWIILSGSLCVTAALGETVALGRTAVLGASSDTKLVLAVLDSSFMPYGDSGGAGDG